MATPVAIAVAGVGVLLAGIFPTQPLFGYPPGTPEGMATDVTPASVAHLLGAFLFLFGLIAAALAFAVRSWRGGSRGWAVGSLAVAALVFLSFGAAGGGPSGQLMFPDVSGLLQRVALVAGTGLGPRARAAGNQRIDRCGRSPELRLVASRSVRSCSMRSGRVTSSMSSTG